MIADEAELKLGDVVRHESLGLGKIVYADAAMLHVYFRDRKEPVPEARISKFRVDGAPLKLLPGHSDPHLDNLPPYRDHKFVRAKTQLNLDDALGGFLSKFSQGFQDQGYFASERTYKLEASERFRHHMRSELWESLFQDPAAAVDALVEVYRGGPGEPLNFLYGKIDMPAYFDALREGGSATTGYLRAALGFIEGDDESSFNQYRDALLALPTRKVSLDQWPTLTWLPFIAAPDRHFLVKPSVIREFASALPWDIAYEASLNYDTYRRSVAMARHVTGLLQDSAANLSGRPLDLIDTQSFMWVVERY